MKKKNGKQELKELFKSVKEVLVNKGLLKEESVIPQEPKEKRHFPRLNLTQDFNRTIILRITQPESNENIKSFANNISIGGICLETKREFRKNNKLNLRLFFYGDKIPMMQIQGRIIWKKALETINYYGVTFDLIEEKNKTILSQYIESKIEEISS